MDRHAGYTDFDEVLKTMKQLENVIQETNTRVESSSRAFAKANEAIRQAKSSESMEAWSKEHEKYLKERRWRKRKIYSRLKGSHLFHPQLFDSSSPDSSAPELLPKSHPEGMEQVVPPSVPQSNILADTFVKPYSSVESARPTVRWAPFRTLEDPFQHSIAKISHSLGTTNNHGSFDVALNNNRTASRRLHSDVHQSGIRFSKWEEQYLSKEIPGFVVPDCYKETVDTSQTYVKVPVSPTTQTYVKGPVAPVTQTYVKGPVAPAAQTYVKGHVAPTASLKPKQLPEKSAVSYKTLDNIGGAEQLQRIIEMQKRRNRRMTAELENDPFLHDGVSNSGKLPPDSAPKVKTADAATDTEMLPGSSGAEGRRGITRKVVKVPPPKGYKGFSAVESHPPESLARDEEDPQGSPLTTQSKTVPHQKSKSRQKTVQSHDGQGDERLGPPPCVILLDSKFIPKEKSSSDSLQMGDLEHVPVKDTDHELPEKDGRHSAADASEKGESEKSEKFTENNEKFATEEKEKSIEVIDLTESPSKSTSESKSDNKENSRPSIDEDMNALKRILNDIQNDDTDQDERPAISASEPSKHSHLTAKKSKKRKAAKQPDAKTPACKVRHYSRETVLAFIEKQKMQRKKQLHEEKRKKQQAAQEKKQRLQHVYECQRLAVSKSKPSQPLKMLDENVTRPKAKSTEGSPQTSPVKSATPKMHSPSKNNKTDQTVSSSAVPQGILSAEQQLAKIISVEKTTKRNIAKHELTQKRKQQDLQQTKTLSNSKPTDINKGLSNGQSSFQTVSSKGNLEPQDSGKSVPPYSSNTNVDVPTKDNIVPSVPTSEENNIPPSPAVCMGNESLLPSMLVEQILPKVFSQLEDKLKLIPTTHGIVGNNNFSSLQKLRSSADAGALGDQTPVSHKSSQSHLEQTPIDDREHTPNSTAGSKSLDSADGEVQNVLGNDLTETVPKTTNGPLAKQLNMSEWSFMSINPNPFNFINTFQRKPLVLRHPIDEHASNLKIRIASGSVTPTSETESRQVELSYTRDSYSSKFNLSDARVESFESNVSSEVVSSEKPSVSGSVEPTQQNVSKSSTYSSDQEISQINISIVQSAFSSHSDVIEGTLPDNGTRDEEEESSVLLSLSKSQSLKVSSKQESSNENNVSVASSVKSESIGTHQTFEDGDEEGSGTYVNDDNVAEVIIENTSDDVDDNELKSDSEKSASPLGSVPSTKYSKSSNGESIESFHSAKYSGPDSKSESQSKKDEKQGNHSTIQSIPVENNGSSGPAATKSGSSVEDLQPSQNQSADSSLHSIQSNSTNRHSSSSQNHSSNSYLAASHNGTTNSHLQSSQNHSVNRNLKLNDQKIEHVPPTPFTPFQVQNTTFFDTGTVTRVAAEAASAAATSAVLAALEYQKILPSKEQLLHIVSKKTSELNKEYSPDFESSKSSRSVSAVSYHSRSFTQNGGTSSSHHFSEQSVVEEVASEKSLKAHSSDASKSPQTVTPEESLPSFTRKKHKHGTGRKQSETDEDGIEEDIPVVEDKTMRLENVSSPSPASLSENESLPSSSVSSFVSSQSDVSKKIQGDGAASGEESFAQLTLDVVRHMTYEEKLRAQQQLLFLQFQERALIEKAKNEMRWLDSLKKKLQGKNAKDQLKAIKKKQHQLVLRLRQELAQLRCMQETYRGVCKRHQTSPKEKKKLFSEPSSLSVQPLHKRELSVSSLDRSSEKVVPSASNSLSFIPSSGTAKQSSTMDSKSDAEIPEVVVVPSVSSAESIAESPELAGSKTSESYSKPLTSYSESTLPGKVESTPHVSQSATPSLESDLKGMKRLEANKRYLTKKEQRLVQRRTHAESLLQLQKRLDMEEKAVKHLEQTAVEAIEQTKQRSKYYISTSTPSSSKSATEPVALPNLSSLISSEVHSRIDNVSSQLGTSVSDHQGSSNSSNVPEEVSQSAILDDSKTSEEVRTGSVGSSISEIGSGSGNGHKTGSSSSFVVDEIASIRTSSHSSSVADEADGVKSGVGSSGNNQSSSSGDAYSDSFVYSSTTPKGTSPSPLNAEPLVPNVKKQLKSMAGPILAPVRHRRHDSSGSDDSFTKSHSETASDQSDIEGRIYALTEELQQQKAVAEKLKREQKKRRFENLRAKEQALQKQLETLHKYIMETSMELDQQLQASSSDGGSQPSVTTVKPQIKQPRVAKSRHLQKQSRIVLELETSNNKNVEGSDHSTPSDDKDSPLLTKERKPQSSSHLAKKLRAIELKEIPDDLASPHTPTDSTPASGSVKSGSSPHTNGIEELIPTESRSRTSSGAGTEGSLSYSSDFGQSEESNTAKNSDAKTPESSLTDVGETSNEISGRSEEHSLDELAEGSPEVSEKSVLSVKALQKHSSHSSQSDESIESVLEEDLEERKSENVSCDGSEGCPSPQRSLNTTFVVGKEAEMLPSGDFLGSATENNVFVGQNVVFQSIPPASCDDLKPKSKETPRPEFIESIVDHLVKSLCEDTFSAVQKCLPLQETLPIVPEETVQRSVSNAKCLTSVNEEVAAKVSESVTSNLFEEAFSIVLKVFKKLKLERSVRESETKGAVQENISSKALVVESSLADVLPQTKEAAFVDELAKAEEGLSPVSNELSKDPVTQKWFYDDTFVQDNRTRLSPIDQQLFVQQYPYYYRQIPNKPPPPYTPPSSPLVHSTQTSTFKPVVKVEEKVTVVREMVRKLETVVDMYVDVLIKEKENGTSLQDVEFHPESVENSDLYAQAQTVFQLCSFELAKEAALKLYVDDKSQIKHRPWMRNQRLTQKPVFPLDKNKVLPALLKEIRKAMHLEVDKKSQSIWSTMKLGRKKRDFVDTIIVSELKEEEPEWVCYDEDEFAVKLQLTNSIFNVMLDDAIEAYKNATVLRREACS